MQRYADLLKNELTARGYRVDILRPEPLIGRLRPGSAGLGKWLGYIDKFVVFPFILHRAARALPGRVVHICDHSNAMYTALLGGVAHLVTCHDLLAVRSARGHFPQNPTGWSGRLLQSWIVSGLRRAKSIVCVSWETKRQLLTLPGFAGKSVEVVPNGLNHPYGPLPEWKSRLLFNSRPVLSPFVDKAYVLFIGGTQWYKNRGGVLRIFLEYARRNPEGAHLLFAGKPFTDADRAVLGNVPQNLRARIHHVGAPDNEGLHALYARAECLFFPSLEEGFGWPLIEAMSVGCPVLTSNRPPMNEIAGSAAAFIEPMNEIDAADQLRILLCEDKDLRTRRLAAGVSCAANFSTQAMVDGFITQYEKIANEIINKTTGDSEF